MADFDVGFDAFMDHVKHNLDAVIKGSITDLTQSVVDLNPVDTTNPDEHVSKGDWQVTIGAAATSDVDNDDPTGTASMDSCKTALSSFDVMSGSSVFIANNKPYIRKLEYGGYPPSDSGRTVNGFSTQAPAGMVGVSVGKWETIVEDNAKKANT